MLLRDIYREVRAKQGIGFPPGMVGRPSMSPGVTQTLPPYLIPKTGKTFALLLATQDHPSGSSSYHSLFTAPAGEWITTSKNSNLWSGFVPALHSTYKTVAAPTPLSGNYAQYSFNLAAPTVSGDGIFVATALYLNTVVPLAIEPFMGTVGGFNNIAYRKVFGADSMYALLSDGGDGLSGGTAFTVGWEYGSSARPTVVACLVVVLNLTGAGGGAGIVAINQAFGTAGGAQDVNYPTYGGATYLQPMMVAAIGTDVSALAAPSPWVTPAGDDPTSILVPNT